MSERVVEFGPEHFEAFQKCVKYWLERFGLLNWDNRFECDYEPVWAFATVHMDVEGHNSLFTFHLRPKVDFDTPDLMREVKVAAFHEVRELMLQRLVWAAKMYGMHRSLQDDFLSEAIHDVIRADEQAFAVEIQAVGVDQSLVAGR